MAPVLRVREVAIDDDREYKTQATKKKDNPVLMDFQKQANYLEKKLKAKKNVDGSKICAQMKAQRKLRDRARYIKRKINSLQNKKELKERQHKISKTKRMEKNLQIKKFRTEIDLLKLELMNLQKKISHGKV